MAQTKKVYCPFCKQQQPYIQKLFCKICAVCRVVIADREAKKP